MAQPDELTRGSGDYEKRKRTAGFIATPFPDVAEVMLRVLTDEGARLIAAFKAGRLQPPAGVTPADYWWTLAEANSEAFTRRILFPSRPL